MEDDTPMLVLELAGKGYTCAQIVIQLGLRVMGRDNPDLLRAMSGLAMGASAGSLCGALTGGLCLIGLHTGKGLEEERPVLGASLYLGALVKWFVQEELKGQIRPECAAIFQSQGQRLDLASLRPAAGCGELVAHTYLKAMELIAEAGLDPGEGREES
jgi:hypothetical protein